MSALVLLNYEIISFKQTADLDLYLVKEDLFLLWNLDF